MGGGVNRQMPIVNDTPIDDRGVGLVAPGDAIDIDYAATRDLLPAGVAKGCQLTHEGVGHEPLV